MSRFSFFYISAFFFSLVDNIKSHRQAKKKIKTLDVHVCMYVCMYRTEEMMDGWMKGWRDDGWMDGWMGGEKEGLELLLSE